MRIVLDTNVLLSAVATRGVCEVVLDVCITSGQHVVVLSEYLLDEFTDHYQSKFGMPLDRARSVRAFLRANAQIVEPADINEGACRDAEDLPVLGTAVAGNADCLVTGDQDLLILGAFRGIPILSPRALYDRLK